MAKVLIVDDDITMRNMIGEIIKSDGHEVFFAIDGEDGEKKAEVHVPDVIFLDVVMPKKNGFQVCRSLKRNEVTKNIPVCMLTAKDQDSDKFWAQKQGADEYLTKPFKEEDILSALHKFLKK